MIEFAFPLFALLAMVLALWAVKELFSKRAAVAAPQPMTKDEFRKIGRAATVMGQAAKDAGFAPSEAVEGALWFAATMIVSQCAAPDGGRVRIRREDVRKCVKDAMTMLEGGTAVATDMVESGDAVIE